MKDMKDIIKKISVENEKEKSYSINNRKNHTHHTLKRENGVEKKVAEPGKTCKIVSMDGNLGKYEDKVRVILERNHVRLGDIAKFTGVDKAAARRIIDTLSLSYPVYEVSGGLYGMISARDMD
jgi:hypothetical protein